MLAETGAKVDAQPGESKSKDGVKAERSTYRFVRKLAKAADAGANKEKGIDTGPDMKV
jgi:hypothetical protein